MPGEVDIADLGTLVVDIGVMGEVVTGIEALGW